MRLNGSPFSVVLFFRSVNSLNRAFIQPLEWQSYSGCRRVLFYSSSLGSPKSDFEISTRRPSHFESVPICACIIFPFHDTEAAESYLPLVLFFNEPAQALWGRVHKHSTLGDFRDTAMGCDPIDDESSYATRFSLSRLYTINSFLYLPNNLKTISIRLKILTATISV